MGKDNAAHRITSSALINPGPSSSPSARSVPVTVIVTVYERTAFLRQALESVSAQSRPPAQIVVCDDSNSAAIREICRAFGDAIEYRPNQARLGVALSVREAILSATQPLVAILNDDDSWEPAYLATLVPPLLDDPRCVLSFGDHWLMNEAGEIDSVATDRNTRRYGRDRLRAGPIASTAGLVLGKNAVPLAMAAVFARDRIDWSHITAEAGGAYDFWITCLLAATGRPFVFSKVRVSRYRIHGGMETASQAAAKNEPLVFIFRRLLELNWFPRHRLLLRRQLALALRAGGRAHYRHGAKREARQFFLRSLRAYPTLPSALGWAMTWLKP